MYKITDRYHIPTCGGRAVNLFTVLAACSLLITLTACGSDSADDGGEGTAPVPIALSAAVESQRQAATRAVTMTQAAQLAADEVVYVWIDEHQKPASGSSNHDPSASHVADRVMGWKLTADGNGGFRTTGVEAYTVMYYPSSGFPVDIYALHGNFAYGTQHTTTAITEGTKPVDTAIPAGATTWSDFTTGLRHAVRPNQTGIASPGQAYTNGYELSDLLYARKYNCPRQKETQELNFNHLLSKVEVYLLPGEGMTADRIYDGGDLKTVVEVVNTLLEADVTIRKTLGNLTAVSSGPPAQATDYYSLTPVEGSSSPIQAKMQYFAGGTDVDVPTGNVAPAAETVSRKAYAFAEAIVVPQWVNNTGASGGSPVNLLKVTLPSGGEFFMQVNTQFLPGKKYIYYVTVTLQRLEVVMTILDWVDGTGSLGDNSKGGAELQ